MPDTDEKTSRGGRKFPCPQCGARLDFDPAVSGLKCPYCGFQQEIVTDPAADIAERDYLDALERDQGEVGALPGHAVESKCPGCGAVVALDDTVAADACPFCTTHLETAPAEPEGRLPPESLVPFAIDFCAARVAFGEWVASRWLAPRDFRTMHALGKLTGIYLPYWTYDCLTETEYRGERGDDYQERVERVHRLADGKTETRTETVTRTRWSPASGVVRNSFDDVLVPATTSLSDARLDGLGDFDLKGLRPFTGAFLSGFQAERYAVNLRDGFQQAKQLMEPTIVTRIRRDIGGDHQRIHSRRTHYSAVTFKHLLLPAWVAAYRYSGKLYQVTVNGQTGRVAGQRPWSTWKVTLVVAAVVLALTAVVAAVARFS
jgi:hypothetical protein